MTDPKENKSKDSQDTTKDPGNDVETVVSNNDNTEPVPDEKQLEEKKEAQD